jgi:hypothetical protein
MKWNQRFGLLLCLMTTFDMAMSLEVSARPKRDLYGCLPEQYQTNFSQSCTRQHEQDLVQGKPYYHILVCNGDEMLCCTRDAKTGATLTCRKPANASRIMPDSQNMQKFEPITSRGVEGEDLGEEIATPPWVTERGNAGPDEIKERGMKRPEPRPKPPIPPKGPTDPQLPPIGPGGTGPTVPR